MIIIKPSNSLCIEHNLYVYIDFINYLLLNFLIIDQIFLNRNPVEFTVCSLFLRDILLLIKTKLYLMKKKIISVALFLTGEAPRIIVGK